MNRAAPGIRLPALTLLVFIAMAGCGVQQPSPATWAGWTRQPVQYARYFQLWAQGGQQLLLTFGPGGSKDTTGIFVLDDSTAGIQAPPGAVRFHSPLRRVALMSTTQASFISALGQAKEVVGCAYTDRLRDTAVAALARNGHVEEIGAGEGVDREKLLLLAPDALLSYPYGTKDQGRVLGRIPVVPVSEYLEGHPLGRAEWIRAFGALFGLEDRADSIFHGIVERYAAALATVPSGTQRPVVFFGSAWKGSWSAPSGNSYMAQLIKDAGGRYLYADSITKGNIDLGLETVLHTGADAAFWGRILDRPERVTAADVAGGDSRVMALPAFRNGGAFYATSAESDLFGQAGLEPAVVLRDLIDILHPGLAQGRKPVYFRPVQ